MLATAGVLLAVAGAAAPGRAADAPPGASTLSITIQAIWQVQQGCSHDCHATSQTQMAAQSSTTVQVASDPADGGSAANRHVTIQIVVQSQRGCVQECYGTSQLQSAVQQIDVNQLAQAVADAANSATATQFVWQYQQGCELGCHDATSVQVVQDAQEGAPGAPPFPTELEAFRAWVAALAASLSATLDFIEQYDVAACLEHCTGEAQVQIGAQAEVTVQVDAATGATTTAAAVVQALRPAAGAPKPRRAATRGSTVPPRCRTTRAHHSTRTSPRRARRGRKARCAARGTVVRPLSDGRRITPTHVVARRSVVLRPPRTKGHWRDSSDE